MTALAHECCFTPRHNQDKKQAVKDRHLQMKVEMEDGEKHWMAAEIMRSEAPRVAAPCVIDGQLFNHTYFKWVKEHFHWDKKGTQRL